MSADYEDSDADLDKLYDRLKREALVDLRNELVKNIEPSKFHSYLISKKVFDTDDEDKINSMKTRRARAETFLNILSCKGGYGFDMLCEVLLESAGQLYLLRHLLECFDKKRFSVANNKPPCQFLPVPGEHGGPCLPPKYNLMESPPP